MKTTRRWALAAVVAALLVAACSTTKPIDPKDESTSLVFGYFDMKDAPSSLEWVTLRQYGSTPLYYHAGAKDGLFWHLGVDSGSYQVEKFGGQKRLLIFGNDVEYNYGTRGRNETAIRIAKPGIYYMGAYRYVVHDGGFFGTDKFEMQPASAPGERELLARLVKELESDKDLRVYTRQISLAKKRLAELSR